MIRKLKKVLKRRTREAELTLQWVMEMIYTLMRMMLRREKAREGGDVLRPSRYMK